MPMCINTVTRTQCANIMAHSRALEVKAGGSSPAQGQLGGGRLSQTKHLSIFSCLYSQYLGNRGKWSSCESEASPVYTVRSGTIDYLAVEQNSETLS